MKKVRLVLPIALVLLMFCSVADAGLFTPINIQWRKSKWDSNTKVMIVQNAKNETLFCHLTTGNGEGAIVNYYFILLPYQSTSIGMLQLWGMKFHPLQSGTIEIKGHLTKCFIVPL